MVPVVTPVKPDLPTQEEPEEEAPPVEAAAELLPQVVSPLDGTTVTVFSMSELLYDETMADWRTHEGLDIAAEADSPVMAAQSGTVTAVYEDDFLGSVVVVSHDDDCSTLYANLAKAPEVSVGDTVSAGDVIGRVGGTALLETKEPDHLHFEVFSAGTPVDPMDYLPSAS